MLSTSTEQRLIPVYLTTLTLLLPSFSVAALVCELLSDRLTQQGRKHKTA